FTLAEGSDTGLSIDSATGAVTLSDDPNHETQSQYNFAVIATDGAGNASEAQSVTLDINNLDEIAPSITSGDTAAVDENIGENQVIYTVTSDDTADISQGVTYSLGAASDSALSINADTGEVLLSTDPDYETQSAYQFTVFATDAAGNRSAEQAVTLSINDLDDSSVTGKVYHWGTQTMLDNVSISLHNQTDGEMMSSATTDGSGIYSMTDLAAGDITLTVERDTQGVNDSQEITHEDVVAALKMAVGLNPNAIVNGHQNAVTPYQFIAADINKDGRITSFDALSILRMSLNEPDAIEQEWMFVNESADFWNEYADDVFNIDKSSVNWDSDPTAMTLTHPDEMNFVGVLLGDVDNSWSAPEDAVAMPDGYFDLLEDDGIAPLEQWGLTDQFVYTGTDNGDHFGLSDVDTVITSGAGEDQFILDSVSASATHIITDFESGVDTIQMGKIMVSAGYKTEDALTQLASAEMSADILDLVNGDDSRLDNLFGATYDEDSNTLTVFADNDSSVGATDMNSIQITLDDSATVEDDDIVANLSPFIA
ncbi:cadherin domain-containing protein, partial [Porticoccaceae bacterium]|nr:cadherin domain-containing protein [Porticoccaceae bacterium]